MGVVLFLVSASMAQAAGLPTLKNANDQAETFAKKAGFAAPGQTATPEVIAGQVIRTVTTFLGVVFFILIVYGGWKWLLARGNEEEVTKGKEIIKQAVIGLIIVFGAYLVANFVVNQIIQAVAVS